MRTIHYRNKPKPDHEKLFLAIWNQVGIRGWNPVPQHRFHPVREWRADFAWLSVKVMVEIDGGAFINGGHNRGRGMMGDAEKRRAAAVLGWQVLVIIGTELDERPCEVIDDVKAVLLARQGAA